MNLPLWIAARYLRRRPTSGFISLLTGISVAGVAPADTTQAMVYLYSHAETTPRLLLRHVVPTAIPAIPLSTSELPICEARMSWPL